jgi:hypothetical protein
MGQKMGQVVVDVDDQEAIQNLKKLLDDDVRAEIESDPLTGLKRNLDIDFPNAPSSVKLPDPDTIRKFIGELEREQARGEEGKYAKLAHGIILLYVAHGNGLPGPPNTAV